MKDSVKDNGRTRRGRGGGRGGGSGGPRADRGRPGRGRRPRRTPRARRSRRPCGRGGRIDPGPPGQAGGARRGGRGRRGGGRRRRPHQGRAARARRDAGRPHPVHRVRLQEVFPGQTPEPAGRQEEDALPGLRLRARPSFLVSLPIALASGLLVSAASPPLGWWPLAFVGVAPFLWLLRSAGGARGAALGFAFGLGSYGADVLLDRPVRRDGVGGDHAALRRLRGRVRAVRPGGPAPRPSAADRGRARIAVDRDGLGAHGMAAGRLQLGFARGLAGRRPGRPAPGDDHGRVGRDVRRAGGERAPGGGGGRRRGRGQAFGPVAAGCGVDPRAAADPVLRPRRLRHRRRDVAGRRPAGGAGLLGRRGRGRRAAAPRAPRAAGGRSAGPRRLGGGRARSGGGQRPRDGRRRRGRDRRGGLADARRAPCSTTPTARNARASSC